MAMTSAPRFTSMSEPTQDRIFLGLVLGYFMVQTILRTALGGSFEMDEAEMIAMARDFRLGYGPQLPLFNWLQAAGFKLFGVNTFALTATKNGLLCLTYAGAYVGLRQKLPVRLSILGTLGLLLLPNLSWEGQRAGSHTIAMLAAMSWCFWVLIRQWRSPRFWHWIVFGFLLAAGGLSKYNFWLFPLTLFLAAFWHPELRAALWRREALISLVLAGLLLILPYGWIVTHMDQALSSTRKFYYYSNESTLSPRQQGLTEFVTQSLLALLLTLLTLFFAWLPARKTLSSTGDDLGIGPWLIRAGLLGLLLSLGGIVISGTSDVQARWLLPALIPLSVGLMVRGGTALSTRASRNIMRFCAVLALLLIAAMADIRLRGAGSDSMRVDLLADEIESHCAPGSSIAFDSMGYYFLGNLKYHRPDWLALPAQPERSVPESVSCLVVVNTDEPARAEAVLQTYNVASRVIGIPQHFTATLPYRFEPPEVTKTVPYFIIQLKNGAQ
ncbi:ArnT family glycosyltransferase [Celeribacter persicus]|uniref:Dolichyl-phosphate-mannose-protein mannosyltransferase n=1 Tax=Celeribacter persicus TaxID=1651082 RepID=A0A2T5HPB6_9RHOB|nr:glycosyltransferase family 39 protein [Celeribacter persicus]PTQ73421.1 dolichyl-phosphate-mannose-protein mannosyltransferase [Celeribacter persicus]